MTARLIDGKSIAETIKQEVRVATDALASRGVRRPGLAVVMVGDNAASQVYVRNKRRSCEEAGIVSSAHDLPATTSEAELLEIIDRLNADPACRDLPGVSYTDYASRQLGCRGAGDRHLYTDTGGVLHPCPGISSEVQYCYLARDLSPCRAPEDADEIITVCCMGAAEVDDAVRTGRMTDAKSIAIFARARALGHV